MRKVNQYKRYTRSKVGNIVYFSFLVFAGLFTLLPMIYMIVTSFKPLDELMIFPPKFFVTRPTFANYSALPALMSSIKVPLSRYIFNSLFLAVTVTFFQIIISSMAAFVMSKVRFRWIGVFFLVVQFSLLYNGTTLGIPQYIIYAKLGMINTYLVYILPALQSAMAIFLMKQYIDDSIPEAMIEAARIDGASLYKIYFHIVMPNIKPAWMTVCLFGFQGIWSMQASGTIFNETLKTLPSVLSQISAGGIARAGSSTAASVLIMIPMILVYLITQSNIMETMSSAGIKE